MTMYGVCECDCHITVFLEALRVLLLLCAASCTVFSIIKCAQSCYKVWRPETSDRIPFRNSRESFSVAATRVIAIVRNEVVIKQWGYACHDRD